MNVTAVLEASGLSDVHSLHCRYRPDVVDRSKEATTRVDGDLRKYLLYINKI